MSRLLLIVLLILSPVTYADMTQEELTEILAPRIEGLKFLTKNGMLLEAIRDQNRMERSLDEIKQIDAEWRAGTSPLIKELQENKAGSFLKNIIIQQADVYSEAFLTDEQGANVAAYPATSDFWQGDEEKFTASFQDGKGQIFIGPVEYDESTQANAVQISVPMEYNDTTIGVLVIGVKVSVLEAEKLQGN